MVLANLIVAENHNLEKRNDLTKFYSDLFVTHEVFKIINEGNTRIFKEERENKVKKKELSADSEYILSFTKNRKNLFLSIIDKMIEFNFKDIPSLGKGFNGMGPDSSRYEVLSTYVFLYEHTFNVVIQTVDMLSESDHPESLIEVSMLIAFFHDFGKCPQIQLSDTESAGESHEKISANYSKHFLTAYNNMNPNDKVSEEVIELVYKTLYFHHTPSVTKGVFLKILIEADTKARDLELRMVKMQRTINEKI